MTFLKKTAQTDGLRSKGLHRLAIVPLAFAFGTVLLSVPTGLASDKGTKRLKRGIEHFQRGNSLFGEKKLEDAIAEFRAALREDSKEPYWHAALAKALEAKRDLQGALPEYEIASRQSPLDSGLRKRCEELASQLRISVENKPSEAGAAPGEAGQAGTKPFSVGGVISPPIPIFRPEPAYSEKARKAKYQGTAVVLIVVDAQGNVTETTVVRPLGAGLDEKALEAVRSWRFRPALRNGTPVQVRVSVEIKFRLF